MAKQKDYDFSKGNRKKEIDNCQNCQGAPDPEVFDLQGMCGTFCNKNISGKPCMQVIDWKHSGQATTIRKKHNLVITESSGISETIEATTELTPGIGSKITFGQLTVK